MILWIEQPQIMDEFSHPGCGRNTAVGTLGITCFSSSMEGWSLNNWLASQKTHQGLGVNPEVCFHSAPKWTPFHFGLNLSTFSKAPSPRINTLPSLYKRDGPNPYPGKSEIHSPDPENSKGEIAGGGTSL